MATLLYRHMTRKIAIGVTLPSTLPLWSWEHYVTCLKKASELFEAADVYEYAITCEKRLQNYFETRKRDLPAVVICQRRLLTLYDKLAALSIQGDTRPFGTFYRVGFYGVEFGDMNGKEYIYREANFAKLPEVTSRLVQCYSQTLKTDITVFKDSSRVDRTTVTGCKLQVTSVHPYLDPLDATRNTPIDSHTRLTTFRFDTPFTKSGGAHGSIGEQFKRRTTVTVKGSLPTLTKRLEVVQREDIVLSPIECVIEDIQHRTHRLIHEAYPPIGTPSAKTLTQVLSGSVTTQVHGGAAEVCATFLGYDSESKFDSAKLEVLRKTLAAFVDAAGDALNVLRSLSGKEETSSALLEALDAGYCSLVATCRGVVLSHTLSF